MSVPQYHSATSSDGATFVVDEDANQEPRQTTRRGYEIPVPSRGQIARDFEKIALADHDEDTDEGTDEND